MAGLAGNGNNGVYRVFTIKKMKKPSRWMPQYKSEPMSYVQWFLLGMVLASFGWLVWKVPVILLIVPIVAVVDYFSRRKLKKYFDKLLQARNADSLCTFSRYFDCRKVDTWVIRAVYEQLQHYVPLEHTGFPIRPGDDVFTDLRIDEEDFECDVVKEIAQRTGRTLDNPESNPHYGRISVVENLVYFFNCQPKIATDY